MTTRFGPAHSTCPVTSRPTQLAGLSPSWQPYPVDQPFRVNPVHSTTHASPNDFSLPFFPVQFDNPSLAQSTPPDNPHPPSPPPLDYPALTFRPAKSYRAVPDLTCHYFPVRASPTSQTSPIPSHSDYPVRSAPTPLRQPSHRYPTGQDTPIRIPTDRSSQSQPLLSDYPDHAHFSPTSRLTPRQFSSTIRALSAQIKFTTDFPALLCPPSPSSQFRLVSPPLPHLDK